jgi:hypothetical protein
MATAMDSFRLVSFSFFSSYSGSLLRFPHNSLISIMLSEGAEDIHEIHELHETEKA